MPQPQAKPEASPAPTDVAWDEQRLADPHQQLDKAERVRHMFSAIAGSYDTNNRLHSFWLDQVWRKVAVKAAGLQPTDQVLDVACGTGDLTLALASKLKQLNPDAPTVQGVDFTEPMLQIARKKAIATQPQDSIQSDLSDADATGGVSFQQGDAMALQQADASVDVVSIAFGIRNISDPHAAIREFFRVLRPGGRLVILEFSTPRNPLVRWAHNLYTQRVMPRTATLIARDRSGAYRYLPRSVETFLDREAMANAMRHAGFADVTLKPMTLGTVIIYRGVKV